MLPRGIATALGKPGCTAAIGLGAGGKPMPAEVLPPQNVICHVPHKDLLI